MMRRSHTQWPASARRLGASLALLLFVMSWPAGAQDAFFEEEVVLTGDWPPFMDEEAPGQGATTAFMTAVLHEMGVEPNYRFLPTWRNTLNAAHEGAVFATFSWSPDRSDIRTRFLKSDPIYEVTFRVFVDADRLARGDFDAVAAPQDLGGMRGVRMSGYLQIADFDAVELVERETTASAFDALLGGDVDFVIEARRVGEAVIERDFFIDKQRFALLEGPALRWSVAQVALFPTSRSDPQAEVDRFNAALAVVRDVTSVDRILEQTTGDFLERRIVRLTDPGAFSLVTGKFSPDSAESVIIPRGATAVVVDWSANFETPEVTTVHRQMNEYTRVRLLNGPLKDEVLYVRNMFIELPEVNGPELNGMQ
ncbi:MAG: transporter substrate-binding domain-containing protein [Maricaulaceae bacterium]|jgi:hypothetical protein